MRNNYLFILLIAVFSILSTGAISSQNKKIDSLQLAIKNMEIDSLKVNLAIQLAREYHRIPDHDSSVDIAAANNAVLIALESGDSLYYARALNTLGLLYRYHGYYDVAVSSHKKAYTLVEPLE